MSVSLNARFQGYRECALPTVAGAKGFLPRTPIKAWTPEYYQKRNAKQTQGQYNLTNAFVAKMFPGSVHLRPKNAKATIQTTWTGGIDRRQAYTEPRYKYNFTFTAEGLRGAFPFSMPGFLGSATGGLSKDMRKWTNPSPLPNCTFCKQQRNILQETCLDVISVRKHSWKRRTLPGCTAEKSQVSKMTNKY